MDKSMFLIKDVTPHVSSWTVKVLVESKTEPRKAANTPKWFQRLIFMDEKGDRVNATIYDRDIKKYEKSFVLLQTYHVSNARVCEPKDSGLNIIGNYHWVITSRTVVTKALNDVIPRNIAAPVYVPLAEITSILLKDTVDILALVVHHFGNRTVERTIDAKVRVFTVAEFGIVDESERPMVLSLWNNIATSEGKHLASMCHTFPVISATKMTTSNYYGLSVGSTPNTSVIINPDLPVARRLHSWYSRDNTLKKRHMEELQALYCQRHAIVDANASTIVISAAHDLEYNERFAVKGKIQIFDDQQKFFYMTCDECAAPYAAEYNWTIDCRSCNRTTKAKPRALAIIQIVDDTGDLTAALFGNDASNILYKDGHECMRIYNSGEKMLLSEINEKLDSRYFIVQLRKTLRRVGQTEETRYVVNGLLEVNADGVPMNAIASNESTSSVTLTESSSQVNPTEGNVTGNDNLPLRDVNSVAKRGKSVTEVDDNTPMLNKRNRRKTE